LAGYTRKALAKVKVSKVLDHPTWDMGKRVTVDSATLVNKGFEVIETHRFFNLPYERIGIVLHKESVAHAFLEHEDNTLFSCLYSPDMKMPIAHALYYPKRPKTKSAVNFKIKNNLSFSPLNYKDYPLLGIILAAAKREDNSLVILNAADEVAIDYFLRRRIKFTDIHKVMTYMFKNYRPAKIKRVEDVFYWDKWAREEVTTYLKRI